MTKRLTSSQSSPTYTAVMSPLGKDPQESLRPDYSSSTASINLLVDSAEPSTNGFLPAAPIPPPCPFGMEYQQGKYFGIPVGQLVGVGSAVSTGSGFPDVNTERAKTTVPARSFETKLIVPVEVESRWSTSSDEGPSIPYNVISWRPEAKTQLPHRSRQGRTTHGSPMRERFAPENMEQNNHGNRSNNANDIPSNKTKYYYAYPEFPSVPTVVIRGGFGPMPKVEDPRERVPIGDFFRMYPPPSNKDYEYTSDGRDPKFVYHPPAPIVSAKPEATAPPTGTVVQQQVVRFMPRVGADGDSPMEMEQAKWHNKAIRLLGLGLGESATDEERDFVYREAYNLTEQRNGHCWRCDCVHIMFGPPETLPDRDTCGAYLPGWFPAKKYQYPWREFRELWREVVYLEETGRSFEFPVPGVDQQQPMWDREYHVADPKWMELHPEGRGWWKCRNDPHATEVELNCDVCHKIKVSADKGPEQMQYLVKKDALVRWVYGCLKHMGVDDKAAAKGIILRLGFNRISHYPYAPGNGEKARESRFMPETLQTSMPLSERDENYKGKALEVLELMEYPSMLQPRDKDSYSARQTHPYKYLSGSREPKPHFDVRNLWNEDYNFNSPADLKTYTTTMQENYDPRVGDDEKAKDEQERKPFQTAEDKLRGMSVATTGGDHIKPLILSLTLGSPSVAAPTLDHTKATRTIVSGLEAMFGNIENVGLDTSPIRISRQI